MFGGADGRERRRGLVADTFETVAHPIVDIFIFADILLAEL